MLVIIILSLVGCKGNLIKTNINNDVMFIKAVIPTEDKSIMNAPIVGFLPKIYDYEVNENIKTMLIEVTDYTDASNPKIVNSYAFKLSKEELEGRIYLKYNPDEKELGIEIKSQMNIDKISSTIDIYDQTDSYAMSFKTESEIKEGKSIPIIAILYADSFSGIEEFLNNPKQHEGIYSSAYQITITFNNKDLKK